MALARGVECQKDRGVLDENTAADKDINAVMMAQHDLVKVAHELKQVVKGHNDDESNYI